MQKLGLFFSSRKLTETAVQERVCLLSASKAISSVEEERGETIILRYIFV